MAWKCGVLTPVGQLIVLARTLTLVYLAAAGSADGREGRSDRNLRAESRATATIGTPAVYVLPDLGFPYDALKGTFVGDETMHLHHDRHHATYVDMLNKAVDQGGITASPDVAKLVSHLDQVPVSIRAMVRNHGGGHLNHLLFWKWLRPGGHEPRGALAGKIAEDFGSLEAFRNAFEKEALARFGSGWSWLVLDGGRLRVCSTANQDNPVMDVDIGDCHGSPILGLDVWEHAYYLDYHNVRPSYVKAFWKVANWDEASALYDTAVAKAEKSISGRIRPAMWLLALSMFAAYSSDRRT